MNGYTLIFDKIAVYYPYLHVTELFVFVLTSILLSYGPYAPNTKVTFPLSS